ncbi:hypothetical protein TRFO_07985 [Tritrichomonas foetus]|uniref:NET domain-containing protein n=1 Tax=Tritrichomonas foetus TaxID=1144522 RepID=A0A1J4JMH5_9EUKA|nr:hypothetical protein TRFO_07985 [Tritrichomonas foetus]|eukprot:OHT00321.1 hypothetical protein TRFO_07985 [Tritrichomonas foetus]
MFFISHFIVSDATLMESLRVKACLKFLYKVMNRPICRPFLCDETGRIRYSKLADKSFPVKLESLKEDLLNGKVSSYSVFFDRLITFFDMIQSNCNGEAPQICAKTLSQWIKKKKKKYISQSTNQKSWIVSLEKSYNECVSYLENAEGQMDELKYRIQTDPNEPLFFPFEPHEIQLLGEAIKKNENDKTMNGIISIIRALEPKNQKSSSGEFVCDLATCSPQTLHTLRNYIQSQFRQDGIEYPKNLDYET